MQLLDYSWKLPAYSWASLITDVFGAVVAYLTVGAVALCLQWKLFYLQWECVSLHLNGL